MGSLFALFTASSSGHEGQVTDRAEMGPSKPGALDGVRWRPVLVAGVAVGVVPWVLLHPVIFLYFVADFLFDFAFAPEQFALVMGLWGLPSMHALFAAFAAYWVMRRYSSTAVVAHAVLIALVSVAAEQTVTLAQNVYFADPSYAFLNPSGVTKYLVLALAGGLVGGIGGRNVLAGQEALYEASRSIGAAGEPQDVADAIGENPLSPAVSGAALWWPGGPTDEDEEVASLGGSAARTSWVSRGWPEGVRLDGVDAWELVGPGRGASRVLRAGEMSAAARAAWRERRVRSVLVLPLVASGEEIGHLALASRERRFPRSAVRSYQTVAAQAALALENLRLVGEARRAGRQAGVLRERQRMAHEIHDTLAQGFTSIVMNLEAAESVMPREEEPGRVHHHIDQARLTARESLTEARRLVWALRPERLEEATLPEALGGLAERWTEESGIPASVATTGTPRTLPSGVEATLFRVAQEALGNVRKHARGASRVALTLSYMGDAVALDARDDGAGFDPAGEAGKTRDRDSGGFGLRGMRERVEGAGGTLSVESAPGEGTTLAVELPVGPAGDGREAP